MVHFSETCDPEDVHLITHVETTPATVHEAMRSEAIQRALHEKDLYPRSTWSMRPTSLRRSWSRLDRSMESR